MSTLIGRHSELDAVVDGVRGGQAVVLHGAAGIGKTALWRAAITQLDGDGHRVVRVIATETTRAIPLGALAGVLATVDPAPAPERLVAALAQLRAEGAASLPVLAIDDAHLLDDHTAALVLTAAAQELAVVFMTARVGEQTPDAVLRFWKDDLARVISLGGLPADAAAALVEARVEAPVDARTHTQLFKASGGHPLALLELVDAGLRDGAFIDVGGVLAWRGDLRAGPALSELLQTRIDRLVEPARPGAELLAAAGPMPVAVASAVCGAPAIDAVLRAGIARKSGDVDGALVELAHPLYGQMLADRMRPERVHALLTAVVAASERGGVVDAEHSVRTAGWLVKLGDRSQPTMIFTAARRAFDRSDLTLAAHLARAAADAGAGLPADLLLRRIDAILLGDPGDPLDARQPVAIEQEALSAHDRFVVGASPAADALAAIDRAIDQLDDAGKRDELAALQLMVRAHSGDDVARVAADGLALLRASASPAATARAAMVTGPALTAQGRCEDAVAVLEGGLAVALVEGLEFLAEHLRSSLVHALAFAGRVTDAERLATSRYDEAVRDNNALAVVASALPLGQLDLWLGRPRTALRRLGEAVARMGGHDLVGYIPYGHAHLAWARAWIDPDADIAADEPAVRTAGYAGALLESVTRTGYAQAELALGHLARAEQQARDAAAIAHASGQRMLEVFAFHCACRARPTKRLATSIAESAHGCQSALATLLCASADALAADDPAQLEAVATTADELALAPLAYEHYARAASGFERRGAPAAARRCRSASLDVAGRMEVPPRLAADDGAARARLTAREREVARLAAAGKTNGEIAAELDASVRTVHTHLQAAYRKLGVNRRDQLAALLEADART